MSEKEVEVGEFKTNEEKSKDIYEPDEYWKEFFILNIVDHYR